MKSVVSIQLYIIQYLSSLPHRNCNLLLQLQHHNFHHQLQKHLLQHNKLEKNTSGSILIFVRYLHFVFTKFYNELKYLQVFHAEYRCIHIGRYGICNQASKGCSLHILTQRRIPNLGSNDRIISRILFAFTNVALYSFNSCTTVSLVIITCFIV